MRGLVGDRNAGAARRFNCTGVHNTRNASSGRNSHGEFYANQYGSLATSQPTLCSFYFNQRLDVYKSFAAIRVTDEFESVLAELSRLRAEEAL